MRLNPICRGRNDSPGGEVDYKYTNNQIIEVGFEPRIVSIKCL
jgi:hypothetical protein